eukprot:gene43988-53777_t
MAEINASEILSHHSNEHEITHYHLSYYFELAVEVINSLAGMIVLCAVLLAGINLFIVLWNVATGSRLNMIDPLHPSKPNNHAQPSARSSVLVIRLMLGEQIALALALLVASDILDTVLKPSHAYEVLDVVKMGFVTILRTGLAYFLAREIKELEEVGASSNASGAIASAAGGAGVGGKPKSRSASSASSAAEDNADTSTSTSKSSSRNGRRGSKKTRRKTGKKSGVVASPQPRRRLPDVMSSSLLRDDNDNNSSSHSSGDSSHRSSSSSPEVPPLFA